MSQSEQFSINNPRRLIDEVADVIATNVMGRLESQIQKAISEQAVSRSSERPQRRRPTFLRLGEVSERVGLARSTIYNKMSDGSFPRSMKLGARTAAWRLEDIELWERDPSGYSDSKSSGK